MNKGAYLYLLALPAFLMLAVASLIARPASAASPVECGLGWRTVSSPNVGGVNNSLAAVASVSPNDAWAVGSAGSVGLTMHWDGTAWSIVSNPCNGPLTGVSAIASDDVWAVGNAPGNVLVTMHWNGTAWSIVPCPSPGYNYTNSLYGVDALTTNDVWTVGFYRHYSPQGLTMHYDGVAWSLVASPGIPSVNSFQAVKAFAANDVWVAGGIVSVSPPTSIIMHFDGSAWTNVPVANVGKLFGVDGASANDVWAVGTSGILHYDGSTWSVSGSGLANLRGVKALSGNDAWAVGDAIDHWNGISWLYDSTPSGTVNGVDGSSSGDLWAVGSYQNGALTQTFIERYSDDPSCTTPTPTGTTATATRTGTSVATPTSTSVPATSTPTAVAATPTGTPIPATATATPQPVMVSHVLWQGRPAQPNALQQAPITLTLRSGVVEVNYPVQTTDASGYFTVSVGGMSGLYNWRAKGPKYLARSGAVNLTGAPTTSLEIGLMLAGDATDDNRVNSADFNVVKVSFGKSVGDPGYDDRADFTGDGRVNASDFNLLKGNFGISGAPPIMP